MISLDEKGDGRLAYGADLLRDDLQFPEVKSGWIPMGIGPVGCDIGRRRATFSFDPLSAGSG
jgi:hypothetical protein